jgi:hypothetical protein
MLKNFDKHNFFPFLTKEQKENLIREKLHRAVLSALFALEVLRCRQVSRKWHTIISESKDLTKYLQTFPGVPNL